MYAPDKDIDKLSKRFNAQAAARNAGWLGKVGRVTLWGAKKDKAQIEEIIAYAERHSTVARQAMAWARAHGLIVAASGLEDSYGHYQAGVVTLCLPKEAERRRHMNYDHYAGVLVHEIRHAWQDYYGLLDIGRQGVGRASDARTSDQLIANALYEADAYAMGELSRAECLRGLVKNPTAELRFNFKSWFSRYAGSYHERKVDYLQRSKNGLGRTLSAVFDALTGRDLPPAHAQVDWQLYLAKLGRTFDGFDYMASRGGAMRDMVLREVLSPSRALDQFAMRRKVDVGAETLDVDDRKRNITRAHAKPYRMPLPRPIN